MTTCPFHKGGQERKPSFGVSKVDGTCHCFACGWVGSLPEMISAVFGYDDGGAYGEKWLSRNFLALSVELRKPLAINMSRGRSQAVAKAPGFTEDELDSYRYIHPYMYERGLTDEIIEEFDIGYDMRTTAITFPCYYADGTPAFIARRSVKTKYFNYPEDVEKPVYGAERFYRKEYDFAVICESIFNALTCWKWGLPAVALLGTGAREQYDILRSMPVRKFILGLDPDEAGRKGSKKLRDVLGRSKIITEFDIPEGYDLNDLDEKVLELKEFF
jgi:DNA primase